MTFKHTFGVGFALALALAGCGGSTAATTQSVPMTAQMGSGQSGTATLTDNGNGSTSVVIATAGGTDSGMQLAHIHTGVCGSGGPVLVPLTSVSSGVSSTTVQYSLSALTGGNHYINIHNSANASNIQSCGQIQ